jgi:hypothetical protein
MALPSSIDAYTHIQAVLDAVLAKPGATYRCASSKAATRWRMEAYYFRKLCVAQGDNRYNDLVLRLQGDTITFARRVPEGELKDAQGESLAFAESRPLTREEFELEESVRALVGNLDLSDLDESR